MNQAKGALLGLACGDALGRPVEFRSTEQIASDHGTLSEMVGHGTWGQPAGTLTDDTAQALCIARSVVECGGFDPADIAARFVAWYDSGPFDIGNMTRRSIHALKHGHAWDEAGKQVSEASAEGANAGNGSVMRCAPLAVAYPADRAILSRVSQESSRITHADPRCTYGCAILNLTIAGLLQGIPAPLSATLEYVEDDAPSELTAALQPVAAGREPESLSTSGYVIDSLQTALYDALTRGSVEAAIVSTVNRGGDTDTIGAIAGAVAGARFGASEIPARWLSSIEKRAELTQLAEQLTAIEDA